MKAFAVVLIIVFLISVTPSISYTVKTDRDVQALFSTLTPGRTWRETVTLTGYYIFTRSILIPSHTTLQLDAYVTRNPYTRITLFKIVAATDVIVTGGVLDGNVQNEQGGMGIEILDSSHITVRDVTIKNTRNYGVSILRSHSLTIDGCTITNYGDDGIAINGPTCHDFTFTRNHCAHGRATISKGSSGIEAGEGAYNGIIHANHCWNNSNGVNINTHIGQPSCHNIIVEANHCFNNTRFTWSNGVCAYGLDEPVRNLVIVGNICYGNQRGICVEHYQHINVTGNLCYDNPRANVELTP